jgi:hypothetical protein
MSDGPASANDATAFTVDWDALDITGLDDSKVEPKTRQQRVKGKAKEVLVSALQAPGAIFKEVASTVTNMDPPILNADAREVLNKLMASLADSKNGMTIDDFLMVLKNSPIDKKWPLSGLIALIEHIAAQRDLAKILKAINTVSANLEKISRQLPEASMEGGGRRTKKKKKSTKKKRKTPTKKRRKSKKKRKTKKKQ